MSESPFAHPAVASQQRPDGTIELASAHPLSPYAPSVLHAFEAGCNTHPDRLLVAERTSQGWSMHSWQQMREKVERLAQGLHDRGACGRTVMILSHNSAAHLLVTLAAHSIGSPVVPVSVAYSLQSSDFAKLRHITDICDPAVVFVEDSSYTSALETVGAGRLLLSAQPLAGSHLIADIDGQSPAPLEHRLMAINEEMIAKIMFTSGSTGMPKGVITTHGMLSANQQQIRQVWPFLTDAPPVLLDWLPWSHTFGGSHNVNLVLGNGGSLWIDTGRPTPALIGETVRNLADVSPTIYFNVPAGYAALVPILERDPVAAKRFFSRLRVGFFAAAALPQQLWDRIEALAVRYDSAMKMTTSWGMTETSPAATSTHFPITRSDCIGVPLPGVELKLVPDDDRYELLVRGPNITPGYHRRPELYDECFDAEGYLRTGDAVTLVAPDDPDQGLLFAGRTAENFKLTTGTFVTVGTLRPKLLSACAGWLHDAVICGEGHDFVGALVWVHADHRDRVEPDGTPEQGLRNSLTAALGQLAGSGASSRRVDRLLIMTDPPDLDAGEITDKGYVNQRKVREHRRGLVDELMNATPSHRTITRVTASQSAAT